MWAYIRNCSLDELSRKQVEFLKNETKYFTERKIFFHNFTELCFKVFESNGDLKAARFDHESFGISFFFFFHHDGHR